MSRKHNASILPPILRIWVVGPQCAGKSTLVRYIAKRYKLPMLDEVARVEMAKTGGGFDQLRVDLDAVTAFQRNVFATQLTMGAGMRRFVSDRAFENLCYAAENASPETVADLWESEGCRRYVSDIAEDVELRRGAVFFVRPGADTIGDGVRSVKDLDVGGIHRIDGMCKLILQLGRVRYVPIQTTNFQERADIVHGVLRCML